MGGGVEGGVGGERPDPGILRVKGGLAYSCPISLLIIIFAGINNQCKELLNNALKKKKMIDYCSEL